jgi:hypothetical protein
MIKDVWCNFTLLREPSFSGAVSKPRRLSAVGGQAARLTHSSAETGFAQKCKIAPFWEKNGNCRPLGRFFLWRRAAPASCFSGENEIWSTSKLVHFFVFLSA